MREQEEGDGCLPPGTRGFCPPRSCGVCSHQTHAGARPNHGKVESGWGGPWQCGRGMQEVSGASLGERGSGEAKPQDGEQRWDKPLGLIPCEPREFWGVLCPATAASPYLFHFGWVFARKALSCILVCPRLTLGQLPQQPLPCTPRAHPWGHPDTLRDQGLGCWGNLWGNKGAKSPR